MTKLTRKQLKAQEELQESHLESWRLRLKKGRGRPRGKLEVENARNNKLVTINHSRVLQLILLIAKNFWSRPANLWFLFVSLIMLIDPDLSPYPRWIIIFPLLLYMLLYIIKEMRIDQLRKREYKEINLKYTNKHDSNEYNTNWESLKPGDILRLRSGDICPADCVVLNTSLTKGGGKICWVDTQSVNGFTAFQMKQGIQALKSVNVMTKVLATLTYESPNANLGSFLGTIKVDGSFHKEYLSIDNLILRGSIIKNTESVQAICVYTGQETKCHLNSSYPFGKKSVFERTIERFYFLILFILFILALISTVGILVFNGDFDIERTGQDIQWTRIFYFSILYSPLMPISLYAVYDIILIVKHIRIQSIDEYADAFKILDSNVLSDLGQAEYCLLDKTGTLTTQTYNVNGVFLLTKKDPKMPPEVDNLAPKLYKFQHNDLQSKLSDDTLAKKLEKKRSNIAATLRGMDESLDSSIDVSKRGVVLSKNDLSPRGGISPRSPKSPRGNQSPLKVNEVSPMSIFAGANKNESGKLLGDLEAINNSSRPNKNNELKPPIDPKTLGNQPKDPNTQKFDPKEAKSSVPNEGVEFEFVGSQLRRTPVKENKNSFLMNTTSNGFDNHHTEENLLTHEEIGLELSKEPLPPKGVLKPAIKINEKLKAADDKRASTIKWGAIRKSEAKAGSYGEFDKKTYSTEDFVQDFYSEGDKKLFIDNLLLNLSICHTAQVNSKEEFMTPYPVELTTLQFAKQCGIEFIRQENAGNNQFYIIKNGEYEEGFKIIGVNDFTYSRKRSSVVYQYGHYRANIVCKGPDDAMRQSLQLNPDEWRLYDNAVANFQKEGMKVVVIGSKYLDREESDKFEKNYQNLKNNVVSQDTELEDLAQEYEKNLNLVGIMAFSDNLREGVQDTIQFLRDSDLKTWMVTGDNRENSVNVALQTQLIKENMPIRHIKFQKNEDARATLRGILDSVASQYQNEIIKKKSVILNHISKAKTENLMRRKSRISKKDTSHGTILKNNQSDFLNGSPVNDNSNAIAQFDKNEDSSPGDNNKIGFALLIEGDTFEKIFQDDFLRTNFAFICAVCYTVVAYRFSPKQKSQLVQMIKGHFPQNPVVMSIGDGVNDCAMLQESHVGIELVTSKLHTEQSHAGDIQIKELKAIKNLMQVQARSVLETVKGVVLHQFYSHLLLGIPLFLFNSYSKQTGTPLFDGISIFMFGFWFIFLPSLTFALSNQSQDKEILTKFPALYIDGKRTKKFIWRKFSLLFMETLIQSLIIFFLSAYGVVGVLGSSGLTADLGINLLVQYFSIFLIANYRIFLFYNHWNKWSFIVFLFEIGSLVAYIAIMDLEQILPNEYGSQATAIFERGSALLMLIFLIFFNLALSYINHTFVMTRVLQSLYVWAGTLLGEGIRYFITNNMILLKGITVIDVAEIAKYVYDSKDNMDGTIIKMISPNDDLDLKLNKLTLSYNKQHKGAERLFKMFTKKSAVTLAKYSYMVLLLLFGGYFIGQSIIEQDSLYWFARAGIFIAFAAFGGFLFTETYKKSYFTITTVYLIIAIGMKILLDWTRGEDSIYSSIIVPIATGTFFSLRIPAIFILHMVHYIVFEVRIALLYDDSENADLLPENDRSVNFAYIEWTYLIILLFVTLLIDYLGYRYEKLKRREHYAHSKLINQQSNSGEMLSLLLPDFIKDKYQEFYGGKLYEEVQEEPVGILFCEILEFNKILISEGEKVVQILDEVFKEFDKLCRNYGIQKIETVGSSYVACAGLLSCEKNLPQSITTNSPVKRLLHMGLDMVQFASSKKIAKDKNMRIWVGIHYGQVAAGVIGYHKPQFSLIGDTVNTTSRVSILKLENKPPGLERLRAANLRLSDEAYQALMKSGGSGRKGIRFEGIREVKFKGKPMTTVWIAKKEEKAQRQSVISPMLMAQNFNFKQSPLDKLRMAVGTIVEQQSRKKNTLNDKIKNLVHLIEQAQENKDKIVKEQAEEDIVDDDDDEEDENEEEDTHIIPNKYLLDLDAYPPRRRKKYEQADFQLNRKFYLWAHILMVMIYSVDTILMYLVRDNFEQGVVLFGLRWGFVGLVLIELILSQKQKSRANKIRFLMMVVFTYGILVNLLGAFYTEWEAYQQIQLVEIAMLYLVVTHTNQYGFKHTLFLAFIILIMFFIVFGIEDLLNLQNIFFICSLILINFAHVFIYQKQSIEVFNTLQQADKRDSRQEFLASQLLPKHARDKYFNESDRNKGIIDRFEKVTMLYSDIKGFTEFSNNKKPSEVVQALAKLYTRFDQLVFDINKSLGQDDPKLYKLYTIGDAYIVLSFVDAKIRDEYKEARTIVKMAESMRVAIEEVKKEINYTGLSMRLGIHTGELIGGVVGTDIVRYDIYGIDPKIGNEMEAGSKEGKINVSEDTMEILKRDEKLPYYFEYNDLIKIEKLGVEKHSWYIEPIDDES